MVALGDPSTLREVPRVPEAWLDNEPLELLREPLDALADCLTDTHTAMLLADSRGFLLGRWFADRQAGRHLDSTGSVRGADLSEAAVGTNAIGTVAATGQAVRLTGTEHYCDFFAHSACMAEPVRDPHTGAVVAVLTLTCPRSVRVDLLAGWARSIRVHVESHLHRLRDRPASLRVEDTQEWALRQALARSGGDIELAGRTLGLSRATVYRRIKRYRIT
jgi:transcriptional regulator of acetoin/glycerol metabolism